MNINERESFIKEWNVLGNMLADRMFTATNGKDATDSIVSRAYALLIASGMSKDSIKVRTVMAACASRISRKTVLMSLQRQGLQVNIRQYNKRQKEVKIPEHPEAPKVIKGVAKDALTGIMEIMTARDSMSAMVLIKHLKKRRIVAAADNVVAAIEAGVLVRDGHGRLELRTN